MSNKLAIEYLNGPGPIKWLSSPIEEWENNHDFIQWLFPTSTPSKFNPYAPVLTSHIGEYLTQSAKAMYLANTFLFLSYFDYYGKLDYNHWMLRATRVADSYDFCIGNSRFLSKSRLMELILGCMSVENNQRWSDFYEKTHT